MIVRAWQIHGHFCIGLWILRQTKVMISVMKNFLVYLLAIVCIGLLVVAASLLRVFRRQSLFVIKQRSKDKDLNASKLYPLFLVRNQTAWLSRAVIVVSELSLVLILAWKFWAPIAVAITAAGLLLGSYLINYVISYAQIEMLAARVAPYVHEALVFVKPGVLVLRSWFVRRPIDVSLPFSNKDELISLIHESESAQSHLSADERSIAVHSLTFSDKTIAETMIPRRVVKGVDVSATIDLKLLKRLHDSGFSRFPVYYSRARIALDLVGTTQSWP
jgi:CBS domain containing-hemolysin-like protein